MHKTKALLLFCFIGLLCESSFAQNQSAFPSLWYPRSVPAGAMGEEGVASWDVMDAMQYNPANLVKVNGVAVSIFGNPWKLLAGWANNGTPFTSYRLAMSLGSSGSAGLEYTNWNMGEFSVSPVPGGGETFQFYERSIAGAYGLPLGSDFAIGAQMRYVWESIPLGKEKVDHLLFNAGVSYDPEGLSHRLQAGLSFVNFGTAIEYPPSPNPPAGYLATINSDPPPAQMHIGVRGSAVADEFFNVDLAVGAMRPFDKRDESPGYAGHSAFSGLFSDWDDFPGDMTAEFGFGFVWHPISLGAGVSFIQEMYLGRFSSGTKGALNSFLTHGARIGLQVKGTSLTLGYAGRWHNYWRYNYGVWGFPWETFQLDVRSDLNLFGRKEEKPAASPRGIVLSGGYSYAYVMGKMKESTQTGPAGLFSYKAVSSFSNTSNWSLEADFYVNESIALLSSLTYSRFTQTLEWTWTDSRGQAGSVDDHPIETVSLESGFRYHPFEAFRSLFVQASLGIIRMNPVEDSAPRYVYQTFDRLVIGSLIPVADTGIRIIPKVGLRTIFMPEVTDAQKLGGYNQVELGVNVGYRL